MNHRPQAQTDRSPPVSLERLVRAHFSIARFDHLTKNVFVVPGILIPLSVDPSLATTASALKVFYGFIAVCLITCSNYVINEILDAPFDRHHPTKHTRPVASGLVSVPLAYLQWILMMAAGVWLGFRVSLPFVIVLAALWIMGCVYNCPPIRTKDVPYVDVLTESINNPLRMLLGWYMVTTELIPPVSLLVSYWMVGCYFMALKRVSEFRDMGDIKRAVAYRKSFAYYTESSLMVSVILYSSAAMLFFGAFIIRYRIELVLAFPLVALVMAVYLQLSYERDGAVQHPEKLYRSGRLMSAVSLCLIAMVMLLWVDIPILNEWFRPTLPVHPVMPAK